MRDYARTLDRWERTDFELDAATIASSGSRLPADLREAIELGSERTRAFARAQREKLVDLEIELVPGLVTGARYIPVGRVGAYLPAGRFPLTASAFMTVGVAKEAGVPTVIACSPPQPNGAANDAVVYAAHLSGVDRVFVLGGVQALAAMAYGLLGEVPVDMLVGAGNAYVAEAKRQLFGTVSIDLLAGPSEVAVIADETADPELVAADLLGQAEHGRTRRPPWSPPPRAGRAVIAAGERQLETLATEAIAGPGVARLRVVTVAKDRETAATLMDDLAPEHLEVITADDEWYHDRLRNYGSLFLGPWSTVAYSDKGMAGTNHVLPTAGGAKHSAGLSVSRFLKPLTYQRIAQETTPYLAQAVQVISDSEGMAAHSATATMRLDRLRRRDVVARSDSNTRGIGDRISASGPLRPEPSLAIDKFACFLQVSGSAGQRMPRTTGQEHEMTTIFVNIRRTTSSARRPSTPRSAPEINPLFTDDNAACIVWDDNVYFMVLTKEYFATFTDKQVVDTSTSAQALVALSRESREEVDKVLDAGCRTAAPSRALPGLRLHARPRPRGPRRQHPRFLYMDPAAAEKGPRPTWRSRPRPGWRPAATGSTAGSRPPSS